MINGTGQYVRALMLILLCSCTVSSAPNVNEVSNVPVPNRSAGCGIIQAGTGNFMRMETRVLNQVRTYYVRIPINYDPNRAYPIIFRWHGSGGNGQSGGLDIEFSSGNDAIVVGTDGLNKNWDDDTASADLLLFDRMLETIEQRYCINHDRVFSYGFSRGGYFTNHLACERGNVLRASAAVAAGLRGSHCNGKVASWFLHDVGDATIPIGEGKTARDRALAMNGCTTKTIDQGEGCVRYQGCEADPVVWCESTGFGHNIRSDFAPSRVWKFFINLP